MPGVSRGAAAGAFTRRVRVAWALAVVVPAAPACDTWSVATGLGVLTATQAPTRARVRIAANALTGAAGIPPRFTLDEPSAEPQAAATLVLAFGCTWSERWSAQVDLGLPPVVEVHGEGMVAVPGPAGALLRVDLGEPRYNPLVRQRVWNPLVALRYSFREPEARARPFLSAGLSHTWFTDESIDRDFEAEIDRRFGQPLAVANGRPGRTRTRFSAASTWAPVLGAGATLRLAPDWSLSASAGWSPLAIQARLRTHAADGTRLATARTRTETDAVGFALLLGYRFDRDAGAD